MLCAKTCQPWNDVPVLILHKQSATQKQILCNQRVVQLVMLLKIADKHRAVMEIKFLAKFCYSKLFVVRVNAESVIAKHKLLTDYCQHLGLNNRQFVCKVMTQCCLFHFNINFQCLKLPRVHIDMIR